MIPTPDEVPGVTPPPPIHLPASTDEPEIINEPDDVQEQSPDVQSAKKSHGLADTGEGDFILNESGTSVSMDASDEDEKE